MKNCEQTSGQSVHEHGISVCLLLKNLIDILNGKQNSDVLKLPKWFFEEKDLIIKNILPWNILEEYTIFHDVGKPFCLEIDGFGKKHFKNHAQVSYETYLKMSDSQQVANLIRMDMDIHLLKSDGIIEFASRPQAVSLVLSGLAEVLANSIMFGGYDSTSFKIKFKQIEKRGKQILDILKNE